MTATLPSGLLRLFMPRPAVPYAKPTDKDPLIPRNPKYTTLAEFVEREAGHDADYKREETVLEKRERRVGLLPPGWPFQRVLTFFLLRSVLRITRYSRAIFVSAAKGTKGET